MEENENLRLSFSKECELIYCKQLRLHALSLETFKDKLEKKVGFWLDSSTDREARDSHRQYIIDLLFKIGDKARILQAHEIGKVDEATELIFDALRELIPSWEKTGPMSNYPLEANKLSQGWIANLNECLQLIIKTLREDANSRQKAKPES